MDLSSYLSTVNSVLDSVTHHTLAPEGFPRGQDLIDSYTTAAEPLATTVAEYAGQYDATEKTLRRHVADTAAALNALEPAGLDLATLTAENGTAAQANEQAENCHPAPEPDTPQVTPVTRLPAARDGRNLPACGDGNCEVRVSAGTAVPAPPAYGSTLLRVRSIADGVLEVGAKFGTSGTMTSPLATGQATIMNGVEVKAVAVGTKQAVLRLTTG